MDKNTVIGFILIAFVLIGFSWWNQPSEEEIRAQQEQIEKQAAEQRQQQKAKDARPRHSKTSCNRQLLTLRLSFTRR